MCNGVELFYYSSGTVFRITKRTMRLTYDIWYSMKLESMNIPDTEVQ